MGKKQTNEAAQESAASEQQAPTSDQPAAPDLTKANIKGAIAAGAKIISEGGTKADAARAMYNLISSEEKETIVAAFVQGATLTEKGALTYWYNCKRKASKEKKSA